MLKHLCSRGLIKSPYTAVALCGKPSASVIAAAVIAQIAEAVMSASCRAGQNTWCRNCCRRLKTELYCERLVPERLLPPEAGKLYQQSSAGCLWSLLRALSWVGR